VGIKTFTKTRLRWDVMYSFEDLLGRFVPRFTPVSVWHFLRCDAICEVCSNETRSRVILDEGVETLSNRISWTLSIPSDPIYSKLTDLMHSSRSVAVISRTKSRNNVGRERVSIEQPSYIGRLFPTKH
jgi:hypothetical protein